MGDDTMTDVYTTADDDYPHHTDAEIVEILIDMERKTCEIHKLPPEQFRSLCRRNASRLPGRTGLPERRAIETGVVVSAVALRLNLLALKAPDPDLLAETSWLDLCQG
jgi:hypothetical protein